jgi:hypothetical protein
MKLSVAGFTILDSGVVSSNYQHSACGLELPPPPPPSLALGNRLVFCQNFSSPSPIIILLFPRSVVVRPHGPTKLSSQIGYIAWEQLQPKWNSLSSMANTAFYEERSQHRPFYGKQYLHAYET